MLKSDGIKTGAHPQRVAYFYCLSPGPLCSLCSSLASAAAPHVHHHIGRSFAGRTPAALGMGASKPVAHGWRELGSQILYQEYEHWV